MAQNAFGNRQLYSNQQTAMEQNAGVQNNANAQEAVEEVNSALSQAGAPAQLQQTARQSVQEVAEDSQQSE